MKQKKQYQPQVMFKYEEAKERWTNVMGYEWNGGKKVADTLAEAREAIRKTKANFGTGKSVQIVGSIGVSIDADYGLAIVKSRILKRYVTEWEEV